MQLNIYKNVTYCVEKYNSESTSLFSRTVSRNFMRLTNRQDCWLLETKSAGKKVFVKNG